MPVGWFTADPTCRRMRPLISGATGATGKLDNFAAWIAKRESNFNPLAKNPKSSAFGIGQLLRKTRDAIATQLGYNPDTTNPNEQIAMMKTYIQQRYGTSENAYNFWQKHNWY